MPINLTTEQGFELTGNLQQTLWRNINGFEILCIVGIILLIMILIIMTQLVKINKNIEKLIRFNQGFNKVKEN